MGPRVQWLADRSATRLAVLIMPLLMALGGPAGAAGTDFVRVRVDTANLRAEPTTSADELGRVYVNAPLRVVGRKGAWLNVVDFQAREGWIYASLTDQQEAAVVRGRLVNVRSGPSTDNPVVFVAERGVNLLVLGERSGWLRVEHEDGERGWILESLVWGHP